MTSDDPGNKVPFDLQAALELIMDDEELFLEMIEIFIDSQEEQMTAVTDAIDASDAEALRFNAHRLKGALGAFCAHVAYEVAWELEQMGRDDTLEGTVATAGLLRSEVSRLVTALEAYKGSVNR